MANRTYRLTYGEDAGATLVVDSAYAVVSAKTADGKPVPPGTFRGWMVVSDQTSGKPQLADADSSIRSPDLEEVGAPAGQSGGVKGVLAGIPKWAIYGAIGLAGLAAWWWWTHRKKNPDNESRHGRRRK